MKIPPPGSPEAIVLGCCCPRADNCNGKGYTGIEGIYVYSGTCKLHMQEMQQKEQEIDDPLHHLIPRKCLEIPTILETYE